MTKEKWTKLYFESIDSLAQRLRGSNVNPETWETTKIEYDKFFKEVAEATEVYNMENKR